MNYDPNKAIRQALMVARRQAAYGGQQSYPGYRPINPLTGLPEDEGAQVVGSSAPRPIGGGISDGGDSGAPASSGPPGAPSTGNFGRDVAGFAEATAPAMAGAAIGAAMGGPAGAIGGLVGATMAQGLAEATGLSAPATSPPGGFASVAGNVAQTQMGMTPTSNPVDAVVGAVTGPQAPADQENADQGNAQSNATNATTADNANSMSEASTTDAAGPSEGPGAGSPGPGGDAPGGDFARGGRITRRKGGAANENFSKWFGDSHVVEDKISSRDKSPNKPRVVYHGTPADISEFNPVGMGKVSHTFGDYETTRHGMFFAEDPEFASSFAQANTGGYKRPGANVLPVHLSIQNPLYIEPQGISEEDVSKLVKQGISEKWVRNLGHPDYTWEAFDGDDGKFFVDALKAAGYDGVRYHETDPETKVAQRAWVAFNPTQVKSAVGNVGSYDPSDPNITRAYGGNVKGGMDPRSLPGIHLKTDHRFADGGGVQPEEEEGFDAYHGSPHKFEQFDTSKIGTGEGAQAYGYGHYLAEAEPVAKGYRDRLSSIGSPYTYTWKGQDYAGRSGPEAHAISLVFHNSPAIAKDIAKKGLKAAAENEPWAMEMGGPDYWNKMNEVAQSIKNKKEVTARQGYLYHVRVKAKPEHFLDWDAPLSEQHPQVVQALDQAFPSVMDYWRSVEGKAGDNGGHFHAVVAEDLSGSAKKGHEQIASRLQAAGIPGIKYFDQGSRDEGKGTRNYVIFDSDMIQVKRRYADGGQIMPQRDLDADPAVQRALDVTAPFSVSNPMSVFPKPQRMWEDQRPGGAYLAMPTKEDITGHKAAQAEIGVSPGGKPFFNVSRDAVEETGSPGRGSATVKTNLFKQKAGWQWAQAPEGHENTNTLVSINHRGKHHYALNAQFPKGVDLARYENAPSEPRLRPTTKGNVELGEQVGTIVVRGKEHPVYRNAIVRNAGGAVGYADGGMPGDDPTVQRALDITRQAQPTAPQIARQVQPQAMPTAESQATSIAQPRRVFTGRSNLLQENGDHPGRISQRTPSSARGDDPIADNLMADTAASAASPQAHEHNIRLLASYPGMPENLRNAPTEEILQHFTNLAKGNLIFLHDLMPPQIRERAKLWYNGARNIAEKFSDRYDMPDSSAAGAMAALSPQKDWYMNVSLSERLLDILHNQHNLHYTREMEDRANKVVALPKFDEMLDRIRGKRLADITDPKDKALFVRLYDEAHHPRSHRIVTPEGEFGEMRTKQSGGGDDESGEDSSAVSWGSLTEIAKAIQAAESGGTKAELSPLMGQNHKVRNFHNNIVAPDAPHGDVTIDTHAVAAALLRPLSGSSAEVHHNFGSTPEAGKKPAGFVSPKSSGITGISGTYPIIADAYRQAANELGFLPRELQSITWEGIRGIFSPVFKRNSNSVAAINDIWQKHGRGEIDINDARRQILEIAGGMDEPSWVRPSGRAAGRASDSSYERKLYPVRLPGEAPEVDGGIGGEPTGTFAGAEPISERDVAQLARAPSLGRAIRNASEMVPREGGIPASHGRISGQSGKRIVDQEAPDFGGNVAHVHVPDERAQSFLQEQGISSPNVYELRPGKKSGDMFHAALSDAKANNALAAAVNLYDPQEYKDMRLFLTPDKKAGFALKGDDIVSVFNNKSGSHKNISHSLLHLAVKEGGRKLDAFDTVLPSIYATNGFEVISRLPFNDEYAPEGWDYDKFAPFNNGRPDVVFMAYNPKRTSFYQKGEGKYVDDYDQAVKLQDGFVKRVNAGLQKLSSVKKDEPTRADGGSVVERALRLTAPYRPMVALADLFQRQLRGRPPS